MYCQSRSHGQHRIACPI
ncbi:hypothetical protein BC937DRAFT_87622 [Endogone sp. FLAS-F59071]|nr:hypothetical protein BC937DRAFT_87622 [Endogone sp. FLAS-F59071]|eukprot:RUS19347.1 hypothetical protein BC937DRAFT_87622 [Endogone sp. FLAS-F59071]